MDKGAASMEFKDGLPKTAVCAADATLFATFDTLGKISEMPAPPLEVFSTFPTLVPAALKALDTSAPAIVDMA